MPRHELYVSVAQVRAADTNSLLRLYDHVRLALRGPACPQSCERGGRALDRIARELRRRGAAP
jgi:hypothetical protein